MDDATRLDLLLAIHLLASGGMLGVTWIVQLLTYPGFLDVAEDRWTRFHDLHGSRITLVVFPLMLVELVSALVLAIAPPDPVDPWLAWPRLALAVATWVLTAFVSVPAHQQLGRVRDAATVGRLVATHRARTAAWTAGAAVAVAMSVG